MPTRRLVAITCFAAFIALGIGSSILGPTLTNVASAISLPIADAGIFRSIQQFGSVFATFAGGYLLGRYALRVVSVPSVILMAIGFIGIALSGNLTLTLIASLTLGVGTGLLNVTANVAISTLYAENAAPVLSALHTCFGVGLFMGPLIAQQILKQASNWPIIYFIPAVACLILAVLFARIPITKRAQTPVESVGVVPAPKIFWLPLLPMIALLFMYNGAGNSLADWISPHLQLVANSSEATAAQVVSLYGLALTIGRAISVFALHRLGNMRVLTFAISLAILGSGVIIVAGTAVPLVAVGVAMVALGFSPIYPTVIAMAGQQEPDNRGPVTSILAGIASIGGIIVPPLQGWVGGGHSGGMIVTLISSIIMMVALILMTSTANLKVARSS